MKLDRDRLNRLLRPQEPRSARALLSPPAPPVPTYPRRRALEELVDGQVVDTPHGPCLLSERRYPLHTVRGDAYLGELRHLAGASVARLTPQPGLERFDFASAAFLDIETTGLSGGAGTLAFLVGVGAFAEDAFVVSQFFMRHPGEEPALLHAVTQKLAGCTSLVTFNGRGFDVPLLATRFRLAWQAMPLADAPHFDVLLAARRLWRARLESCALSNLERAVLGYERSEADVPGWLIPTLYQQFLQGGDAAPLARIFYHNREDIVSMAALATIVCRACLAPTEDEALHPIDRMALARALEEAGDDDLAIAAYRRALAQALPDALRRAALARLGGLLKRRGEHAAAAMVWQEWITSLADDDVTPFLELAKHYEWRAREIATALMWARWARQIVEKWPEGAARTTTLAGLDHRLARLLRKLTTGVSDDANHPPYEDTRGAEEP